MNPQDQQPNGQSDAGRPDWQQGLVPQSPAPQLDPAPESPVIQTISPTNQPGPEPQVVTPQNMPPSPDVQAPPASPQPIDSPSPAQPAQPQSPPAPAQPSNVGVVSPPPQLADIQQQNYPQPVLEEESSSSIKPMFIGLGITLVIIIILAVFLLI